MNEENAMRREAKIATIHRVVARVSSGANSDVTLDGKTVQVGVQA